MFKKIRARRSTLRWLRRLASDAGGRLLVRRAFVAVRFGMREIRISRPNYVYAQDMIRNFDYYFDVVEPRLERGISVVDYSRPALHRMRGDGLPFWFPELAESMETTGIYMDRARLQPGYTVLDLGAYAGGGTFHFSRDVGPQGRVYAFEPDPRSYECLKKNIELHGLTNVVAECRGVWSHSGRVTFQSEGNMGSAVVEAADRDSDIRQSIEVVSLSDFCEQNRIGSVDFVKMDVEGSELAILASAGDFIRRYRPPMVIEVHSVRGLRTDAEVTRILESHGYNVEVMQQSGLPLPLLYAAPGRAAASL
jgi:FkbM family methyltransferase